MLPAWLTIELALIPVGLALVGAVIWNIRLEGRVNMCEKLIDSNETRNGARLHRIEDKLDVLAKDLNRLIGEVKSAK